MHGKRAGLPITLQVIMLVPSIAQRSSPTSDNFYSLTSSELAIMQLCKPVDSTYPALALTFTKADLILDVRDEANEQDRYNHDRCG